MADSPGSKRSAAGGDDPKGSSPENGSGGLSPNKRARTTPTPIPTITTAKEAVASSGVGNGCPRSPPSSCEKKKGGPLTLVTFNINGGVPRLTKNWPEIEEFLTDNMPDLCCFQEVRLPSKGLPKCKTDDDTGRKRGQQKDDTKKDRDDIALVRKTLLNLARRLGYRVVMSLANTKKAGSAALIRDTCPSENIFFSITPEGQLSKEHDREGRVIVIEYPSVTVLAFYVPNNGAKEESFRRRERWDATIQRFASTYTAKPIIILGDLNVAHRDADLTHPSYFKGMFPAASPQNSGQPGCTPAERQRHTRLLESGGGLVDAYRHLHPATTAGAGAGAAGGVGTDAEGMTWRGTAGNQVAAMGRYYGKGMRIDYFLLSRALASRIKEVRVYGSGADRDGFLGSDHCPLMLTLLP
ncbi:unnamed protein product [Pylaiella littoralis]